MNAPATHSGWIVSRRYDLPLLVLSPTLALLMGGLAWLAAEHGGQALAAASAAATGLCLVALIQGHLVLVLVRSHLNSAVFARWRWRFLLVPVLLLGLQLSSAWICVLVSIVAVYWDVYHSSLQTFGLARIYDARAGLDPREGRGLDLLYSLIVYITPILAGANLVEHFVSFEEFRHLDQPWLRAMPEHVAGLRGPLALVGLAACLAGLAVYLRGLWTLHRGGRALPWPKALLLGNTGFVAVLSWGLLEPLYAFFVMNVFHAVQYYALVWATERDRLVARLRGTGRRWGRPAALTAMLGLSLGYGFLLPWLNQVLGSDPNVLDGGLVALATLNTVSILHFWYDGFIWSVRKRAV